jgi:hypothetical protein
MAGDRVRVEVNCQILWILDVVRLCIGMRCSGGGEGQQNLKEKRTTPHRPRKTEVETERIECLTDKGW